MSELCHLESDHEEERGFSVRLSARTGTFSCQRGPVKLAWEMRYNCCQNCHKCWLFGSGSYLVITWYYYIIIYYY